MFKPPGLEHLYNAAGNWAGDKFGIEGNVTQDTAAAIRKFREEELTPDTQNIITDIAAGVGSMAAFFIPGGAIARPTLIAKNLYQAGKIGASAVKWAEAAGIATSTALEALAEAGSVYREKLDSGSDDEEASDAGTRTFFKNMALIGVTNKLSGFYEAGGKSLKKAMSSGFLFEGIQEAGQSVISQSETKSEVDLKEAAYEGLIGGIVGGGTGGVVSLINKKTPSPKGGSTGTTDSDTLSTGMTQEQLDEQTQKKTVHELISHYTAENQKEIQRQTFADQEAAEQAYQMDVAKAQEQKALLETEIQAEQNKRFVDDIGTRKGLMAVTAQILPEMQENEDPAMKRVGNELRNAHRALWMEDNTTTALKERIYEIEQIEQKIPNPHISMVASRLKDELTAEYVKAERREQEQAEGRQEKAQAEASRARQEERNRTAVDESIALEVASKEQEIGARIKEQADKLKAKMGPQRSEEQTRVSPSTNLSGVNTTKQTRVASPEMIRDLNVPKTPGEVQPYLPEEGRTGTPAEMAPITRHNREIRKQQALAAELDKPTRREKLRSVFGGKSEEAARVQSMLKRTASGVQRIAQSTDQTRATEGVVREAAGEVRPVDAKAAEGTPTPKRVAPTQSVTPSPKKFSGKYYAEVREQAKPLAKYHKEGFEEKLDTKLSDDQVVDLKMEMLKVMHENGDIALLNDTHPGQAPHVIERAWDRIKPKTEEAAAPGKIYKDQESAKRAIRKHLDPLTHRPVQTKEGWKVEEKSPAEIKLQRKYSKAAPGTVVDSGEVKHKMVESTISGLNKIAKKSVKTKVVQSQDQLPEHLRPSKKGDKIKAVIDRQAKTPTVYIVSENVKDVKDAVSQWMHEQVGHYGVFQFLKKNGVDFSQFLGKVHDLIQRDKQFKQLYNEIVQEYAAEAIHLDEVGQRAYFVEEFLGRYSEKMNPTRRQLLWDKIRDFINKWLKNTFRGFDVSLSKAEFNSVMEASKNWVLYGEERKWDEFVETDDTYKKWAKEVLEKNPEIISWYTNHNKMMEDAIGEDSKFFNVLLAWTSPQANPSINAQWAVESYLYLRGLKDSPNSKYPNSLKKRIDMWKKGNLQGSLVSNAFKVNEFLRGLLGDKNATVNDRWMYRVFFGPSKLTEAFVKDPAKEKDADSKWLIDENTAARNKLLQLSRELTEETGHKWSPRDLQAALWVWKKSADTKTPLEKAYDYREAMQTPTDKFGGMSPLQYLKKELANAKTPSLTKELGIDKVAMSPVSSLEKARLHKLADEHPAEDISSNDKQLGKFIEELEASPERHVLTIPSLKDLKGAVQSGSKVFTFNNGKAGYVLDPGGDIQKVFNNSDVPGIGKMVIADAIARGGRTLDCFDEFLPDYYGNHFGFVETGRDQFNEAFMSPHWNLQEHGRPDVVYMKLSAEALERYTDGKSSKISSKQVRSALGGYRTDWTRFGKDDLSGLSDIDDSSSDANTEEVQGKEGDGLDQGKPEADPERPEGPQPEVRFSKATPEQQKILNHIGMNPTNTTKTGGPSLEMGAWDRFVTNAVDSLRPLKLLEKKVTGKDDLPVSESSYKSFSLMSNISNVVRSMLYDGRIKIENGWSMVQPEKAGGLFTVIKGLGQDSDAFFHWMTAKSAEEMIAPGKDRKNLFGKDKETGEYLDDRKVIDTLYAVTKDKYLANRQKWEAARERLREINTSILDMAEAAGIINKEQREKWEREDYIPFYRILTEDWVSGSAEDNMKAMFPKSGVPHIGKIHKLEGSSLNMGDPMMNLVNSYTFLINESLKNMARTKTLKHANAAGMLKRTLPREGKNVISIREAGKATYYKVSDPWVYDAMVEMESMTNGKLSEAMKWIALPKKALTMGITKAPPFIIANIIRDTVQTAALQKSFVPFMDSARGLMHAWRRSPEFMEFVSTGGAFGGSYSSRDVIAKDQESLEKLKKDLQGKGKDGFYEGIKSLWDKWEQIGDRFENATRMGSYLRGVENGMSKADAAYFAKDLLDFHRHGKSGLALFAIRTIPFLNARVQGIDRLARGFTDPKNRMKFYTSVFTMTIMSAMIHAMNDGEDWYDELPKNERLGYWHIPIPGGRLRVPKPFELGSVFGALPEALMSRGSGKWDDKELGDFVQTMITQVFSLDFPQIVKPLVTQFANKDPFTGSPVVPRGEEGLEGPMQYGPRTSKVARELAKIMPEGFDSPRRIDKFAYDVFGTSALLVSQLLDNTIMPFISTYPEDPAATLGDHWLLGRFVRGEGDKPHFTRQQDKFYQMLQESDQALATLREYKKLKEPEEYAKYLEEHRDTIKQGRVLTKVQKQISLLNQQMKLTHRSQSLDAEAKRERLDELLEKRNDLFTKWVERYSEGK